MSTDKPQTTETTLDTYQLGNHTFTSRLIVGTGKYVSYEQMQSAGIVGHGVYYRRRTA